MENLKRRYSLYVFLVLKPQPKRFQNYVVLLKLLKKKQNLLRLIQWSKNIILYSLK